MRILARACEAATPIHIHHDTALHNYVKDSCASHKINLA